MNFAVEKAQWVLQQLATVISDPVTELRYETPFQLLVAVILSAQCTDERVNLVTPNLFRRFPDAKALSTADASDILPLIASISFPNNKAKSLAKLGPILVEKYAGEVPKTVEEIEQLPGAGHKTASVVASVAFHVPAFAVDTHVFRVCNRIGLVKDADTVVKVESQMKAQLAPELWHDAHHLLILHGRYTCTAKNPKCSRCILKTRCSYFESLQQIPQAISGLNSKSGKYYCKFNDLYFNDAVTLIDENGVEQLAEPLSHSTDCYLSKTGISTLKVKDFRV